MWSDRRLGIVIMSTKGLVSEATYTKAPSPTEARIGLTDLVLGESIFELRRITLFENVCAGIPPPELKSGDKTASKKKKKKE